VYYVQKIENFNKQNREKLHQPWILIYEKAAHFIEIKPFGHNIHEHIPISPDEAWTNRNKKPYYP
jgi:hypothetical protein